MSNEQEKADFESWCHTRSLDIGRDDKGDYISLETYLSWEGYQAGRAALQSQTILASDWFDMFMELARSVVVANRLFAVSPTTTKQKVAADAIDALNAHARKHPALQSQDAEDAERYRYLRNEAWGCNKNKPSDMHVVLIGAGVLWSALTELAENALDEAIDHARRIEGDGE